MSGTPLGDMTMTMHMLFGMDLEFAPDPGGVRVTGAMRIEDVSMSSNMGDMPLPTGALGELPIEFVMSEVGGIQAISIPEFASLTGFDLGISNEFGSGYFPVWPEHSVEPGDSWADTVEVSPSMDLEEFDVSMQATSVTIAAYTLVGDTVVDGSEFLHIAFEGETVAQALMDGVGDEMTNNVLATISGMFLWDADGGVVAYALTNTDIVGTMTTSGLGGVEITAVRTRHMRLVN